MRVAVIFLAFLFVSLPTSVVGAVPTPLFVGVKRENERLSYSLNTRLLSFDSLIAECKAIAKEFGTTDPVLLIVDYQCTFQDTIKLTEAIRGIGYKKTTLLLADHSHGNYLKLTEIILRENWSLEPKK